MDSLLISFFDYNRDKFIKIIGHNDFSSKTIRSSNAIVEFAKSDIGKFVEAINDNSITLDEGCMKNIISTLICYDLLDELKEISKRTSLFKIFTIHSLSTACELNKLETVKWIYSGLSSEIDKSKVEGFDIAIDKKYKDIIDFMVSKGFKSKKLDKTEEKESILKQIKELQAKIEKL